MAHPIPAEARIVLTGTVTLQSADAIHAQLQGVAAQPVVEIDCSGITEADLGLIQLILAARKTAQKTGRTVALAQPLGSVLHDILQQGGFLGVDVNPSDQDQAFWLQTAEI